MGLYRPSANVAYAYDANHVPILIPKGKGFITGEDIGHMDKVKVSFDEGSLDYPSGAGAFNLDSRRVDPLSLGRPRRMSPGHNHTRSRSRSRGSPGLVRSGHRLDHSHHSHHHQYQSSLGSFTTGDNFLLECLRAPIEAVDRPEMRLLVIAIEVLVLWQVFAWIRDFIGGPILALAALVGCYLAFQLLSRSQLQFDDAYAIGYPS